MNVKIKRLHPDAVVPVYAKPGDSGFDLVATADVIIAPGDTALVPTGLSVEVPEGYELQVRPRSGITLKTKLRVANSPGTVDSSFRGEVAVIVDNIANPRVIVCDNDDGTHYTDTAKCNFALSIIGEAIPLGRAPDYELRTYIIRKGDKIAQGVVCPVVPVTFTETDGYLTATERGVGGFGSSGVR